MDHYECFHCGAVYRSEGNVACYGCPPEALHKQKPYDSPPFTVALANLRHAYAQLLRGDVRDQESLAVGLLGPAIETLESYFL